MGEAVFARFLSSLVESAPRPPSCCPAPRQRYTGDQAAFLADLEQAVYAAKIASYAQGYMLMRAAAKAYGWNLNLGGIALMWRGGCIIRSAFLGKIKDAFDADPDLPNLLLAPYFRSALAAADGAWRRVVATAVQLGIPVPTLVQRAGVLRRLPPRSACRPT